MIRHGLAFAPIGGAALVAFAKLAAKVMEWPSS
jgi:hypothetical protein